MIVSLGNYRAKELVSSWLLARILCLDIAYAVSLFVKDLLLTLYHSMLLTFFKPSVT